MSNLRRWRGFMNVPATVAGLDRARELGTRLRLDLVYHDHLSRDRDTAAALSPGELVECSGPQPWHMGPGFEGWPITHDSLLHAQHLVVHSDDIPVGGESFRSWYDRWVRWIEGISHHGRKVGVVTHNRNIQALYSRRAGRFDPLLYNCVGPEPLSVHKFSESVVTPWQGEDEPGIYLIRHAETDWGT